jgi:hypothetical protein
MAAPSERDYGPEWIKATLHTELSPLGENVARLLNEWAGGIYHLWPEASRSNWKDPNYIMLTIRSEIATFDFDSMTRLVFLCHDYAIRCSAHGVGPGYTRLMFHQRQREGHMAQRHPTIEQALAEYRRFHPAPETGPVSLPEKEES